ncbi:Enoyl-CoA hydratase AFT3-1 [Exophiala dermatitidis]
MASTPTSSPARTVPSSPGPSSTLRPSKIKLSAIDQCGVRLAGDSSGIVMDWKDWPPKDCPPLQLPISGQTKANRFTEEEEELLQQMRESADSQNVPTAVLVNDLARLVPRHSFIAWTSKIKAVNRSAAVGVGITMCLPACIRIAYAKAKVGFVFSRRGIIMEACSSYFLPRLIGHSRALHLTTTGSVYPAEHPLFGTLFSETCSTPEGTLTRALELADEVAKNTSTVATKMMRELMYRGPDSAEGTHLLDSRIIHGLFGSKDNVEGVQSFLEKRQVNFTGQVPQDAPDWYPWWQQVDIGDKPAENRGSKSKL